MCQQVVNVLPALTLPPALSNAEKKLVTAQSNHKKVERLARAAEKDFALAEERLRALETEIKNLDEMLVDDNGPDGAEATREQLAVVEAVGVDVDQGWTLRVTVG